ncbi:hypothetical protein S7335_1067 [Synechococcus sp. PCC 7335]|nr:hypothetical protein S7335_1067 [Synechococcus sp. PCC 7335]
MKPQTEVTMSKRVNPLHGRAAELNEYATSDLSVEEQLAGGASIDDLVDAGVLDDDIDRDSNHEFTPMPTEEEMAAREAAAYQGPPLSTEEQFAYIEAYFAAYDALT